VWLANCPAAGTFPARPASTAGANTRAGGACPARPGTRSRMLTRPSRVLPVPEGDHRRSATVVVTLRGLSGEPARAAGVTASLPEAVMDPAGLARGHAPGPQPGRVPTPAPGTPGSVSAKPARPPLIAGHAHPGRIRTSSQPDPARSMTRIRRPDSWRLRAHQSGKPGKLKGLRRVRANPAAIWMTWRLTASEPPPAPRSVVRGTRSPLIFCPVASGSRQAARVPAGCSALLSCISGRGCLCREPARRRARHGALRSGDRGGDRDGRRCRFRDGIRQTCARRLLPATSWSLRRGRARRSCSRAGP
jgi:hypothetical protein